MRLYTLTKKELMGDQVVTRLMPHLLSLSFHLSYGTDHPVLSGDAICDDDGVGVLHLRGPWSGSREACL